MQEVSTTPNGSLRTALSLNNLSDDILVGILFSGYLVISDWSFLVSIMLVNKSFFELAKNHIPYVVVRNIQRKTKLSSCKLMKHIGKYTKNLVYLDLSFTDIEFTVDLMKCLLIWKHSLRGINFHGTNISDKGLKMISNFKSLRFLDVSKSFSDQKLLISDVGAMEIADLPNLIWLNIAWTNITDNFVLKLCENKVPLKCLILQCCSNLTDLSVQHLSSIPFESLDISSCKLLSSKSIESISHPSSQISRSLQNFNCSYLNLSYNLLENLLTLEKLKKLDFRLKLTTTLVPSALENKARNKFETTIFYHQDQLKYPKYSVVELIPELKRLCSLYSWPYYQYMQNSTFTPITTKNSSNSTGWVLRRKKLPRCDPKVLEDDGLSESFIF